MLTPEEQDAIVSYASRVVSKYNTNQTDGEVFVFKDVLENGYSTEEETEEGAEAAPPSPAEDVTEPEPLPADDPLWDVENLVITPHVAGNFFLRETFERIVRIAGDNLEAWVNKRELNNVVDMVTGYKR